MVHRLILKYFKSKYNYYTITKNNNKYYVFSTYYREVVMLCDM